MKLTFDGETKSLEAWAEEVSVSLSTLRRRLAKGWTPFEALTTPSLTAEPS